MIFEVIINPEKVKQ